MLLGNYDQNLHQALNFSSGGRWYLVERIEAPQVNQPPTKMSGKKKKTKNEERHWWLKQTLL